MIAAIGTRTVGLFLLLPFSVQLLRYPYDRNEWISLKDPRGVSDGWPPTGACPATRNFRNPTIKFSVLYTVVLGLALSNQRTNHI